MDRDESRQILAENYPPNSKSQRARVESQKPPEEKKLEKVTTGKVQQKRRGFGKKMAESFLEDDTKNVFSYVLYDVLIPAAKAMISDMIGGGIEMLLFGERKGNRTKRENGRSYTSYGTYYRGNDRRDSRDNSRSISNVGRARHDFGEIILETRGEAEEVLSHLVDLTIDYGMASVADLYDLVGISSEFTDNKYGWADLRNASVSRVRGGYLINLPRTQPLD